MAKKRKRNFKKKEDPFSLLGAIMKGMDLMEEAVPGYELNGELPVKSGELDRFIDEYKGTGLADEIRAIKDAITMYEEYRKPDAGDIEDVLAARERVKMMCEERCTELVDVPAERQNAHYKKIEESLKKALYLNKKAMHMAEKYRRQKECRNINTCINNYLNAVKGELERINGTEAG